MRILVDTREQRPLVFSCPAVREALPVGDYAVEFLSDGSVAPVMFERKSVGDLFGTMSRGYERFRREIGRAERYGIKLVLIVEGSAGKVLRGYKRYQRTGASIIKQLFFIRAEYDVETVFCQNREEMAMYIEQCFKAYKRLKNGK